MNSNNEKLIFSIDKSENSKYKIYFREVDYNGNDYVDMRLFYLGKENEYLPSKNGIMITHEKFEELFQSLKSYRKSKKKQEKQIESENNLSPEEVLTKAFGLK